MLHNAERVAIVLQKRRSQLLTVQQISEYSGVGDGDRPYFVDCQGRFLGFVDEG